MSLLDEVRQHFFGDSEIGDNTVFHRPYSNDVTWGATKHILGFFPDGFNLIRDFVDCNNRGLVDDDASTFGIDQSIRCTQVNRQIAGEQTKQRAEVHVGFLGSLFEEKSVRSASLGVYDLRPRMSLDNT